MSFWRWLAARRQEDILKLYKGHLEKVLEVVVAGRDLFEAFARHDSDNVARAWSRLFDIEREADEVKRRILRELAGETFHPIDREELMRLVLTTDDVATCVKEAGGMATMYRGGPPGGTGGLLVDMIRRVEESVRLAYEAVDALASEPRRVLDLCDKMERLEEEVDETRRSALASLLRECKELGVEACILLKDMVDYLEMAADKAEDVADVLRMIAIHHL